MDLRIAGRRALVTASSSGIGYAIAEALAREAADGFRAALGPALSSVQNTSSRSAAGSVSV